MDFKQYLAESEKTYCYRIKTVGQIDKSHLSQIEKYLQRYNLKTISKITKTILQSNPMDFASVQNAEVFIVDIETGLPISSYILGRELAGLLKLPEDYLVVRGENDPLEIQNDMYRQSQEISDRMSGKGQEQSSLLDVDSDYPAAEKTADGSNYYGNEYNEKFLGYLRDISKIEAEKRKVEPKDSLFGWLDIPKESNDPSQDTSDFNKNIKKPEPSEKLGFGEIIRVGNKGNYEDEGKVVKKTVINKTGNKTTLAGKPSPVRK